MSDYTQVSPYIPLPTTEDARQMFTLSMTLEGDPFEAGSKSDIFPPRVLIP